MATVEINEMIMKLITLLFEPRKQNFYKTNDYHRSAKWL